jgi:formylglycine-generating enzyme required for sulfatase activity
LNPKKVNVRSRKIIIVALLLLFPLGIVAGVVLYQFAEADRADQLHYERDETELVVVNTVGSKLTLFQAGKTLTDASLVPEFDGERIWLTKGDYFLQAGDGDESVYYPVPIQGYRSGTEKDDSFAVTIRPVPESPPTILEENDFVFVASGHFLFGDRNNPNEPHLVWTPGFFIGQFEVSNVEFRTFLIAPDGYADDANWTPAGREWKAHSRGRSSAGPPQDDAADDRFRRDDHPVTEVTWFEAAAYCRWLTRKLGGGRWLYSLPSEAEWEKAARGPDNFNYPLGRDLSDADVALYNWKKNPLVEVTVIGRNETPAKYQPNRYGIYHLGGNVVEWTEGLYSPFNREKPYSADDGRNREDLPGVRVVRGGSWYSASNALLYIPYRDTFQPEISHNDLGFRIVARSLMN